MSRHGLKRGQLPLDHYNLTDFSSAVLVVYINLSKKIKKPLKLSFNSQVITNFLLNC